MNQAIEDFNRATMKLLDIPIRDEREYKQWEKYLEKWSDPALQTPQEIIDKIMDSMVEFKTREC